MDDRKEKEAFFSFLTLYLNLQTPIPLVCCFLSNPHRLQILTLVLLFALCLCVLVETEAPVEALA